MRGIMQVIQKQTFIFGKDEENTKCLIFALTETNTNGTIEPSGDDKRSQKT